MGATLNAHGQRDRALVALLPYIANVRTAEINFGADNQRRAGVQGRSDKSRAPIGVLAEVNGEASHANWWDREQPRLGVFAFQT